MEFPEAHDALEELVGRDEYEEVLEDIPEYADVTPAVEHLNDRAILYIQISHHGDHERKVLAEYQNGDFQPVSQYTQPLENILNGAGEVEIDGTLLEPRKINFPEQRHHV